MAGPLRGSYNGTPYEISGDRRSGTVTVTDPKDGSTHTVSVTRTQAGRLTVTEIDGHWMSTINMMASAEQKAGIAKMIGMIHGSESQITREINRADGVVDPTEEAAKLARLKAEKERATREADAKRLETEKLAQRDAERRVETEKRKTDRPEPLEGARDRSIDLPPAPAVRQEPVLVDAKGVPLPRPDPRKGVVRAAVTRPADTKQRTARERHPAPKDP